MTDIDQPSLKTGRDWTSHPPLIHAPYKSSRLRVPAKPLVPISGSLSQMTGPVYGHDAIAPLDNDLTRNAANDGEPLGERIIVTGRVLEHWQTGVMTRRSKALHNIEPNAFVSIHPSDAKARGIEPESWVEVRSRRGQIFLEARVETSTQPGSIFIPFHYREAAANILTTDKVDPDGKIPEFKFCAVEIETASES